MEEALNEYTNLLYEYPDSLEARNSIIICDIYLNETKQIEGFINYCHTLMITNLNSPIIIEKMLYKLP